MPKQKNKMSKSDRNGGLALIACGLIIIILMIAYLCRPIKHYDQLNLTKTNQAAITQQLKNNKVNHLTFEYYYSPTCNDCKRIEKQIVPKLHHHQKDLTVINVNNKKTKDYYDANEVTYTPTLIVKYHGYSLYSYAGTNMKRYQQLLAGTNPDTGKKFKLKQPAYFYINNQFTNTHSKQDAIRVNTIHPSAQNQ